MVAPTLHISGPIARKLDTPLRRRRRVRLQVLLARREREARRELEGALPPRAGRHPGAHAPTALARLRLSSRCFLFDNRTPSHRRRFLWWRLRLTMGIQTSLYLIAVALCAFSTGLTTRRVSGRPLRYFTAFLVVQSFSFLCELWIAHPATPWKSLGLGALMSSALLLAPCLWLAVQEGVTGEAPRLRDLPRRHWYAVVAGALFTLPLVLSAHGGTTFYDPQQPVGWLHSRFIHTTMIIGIAIFVVQVPWYLARC